MIRSPGLLLTSGWSCLLCRSRHPYLALGINSLRGVATYRPMFAVRCWESDQICCCLQLGYLAGAVSWTEFQELLRNRQRTFLLVTLFRKGGLGGGMLCRCVVASFGRWGFSGDSGGEDGSLGGPLCPVSGRGNPVRMLL